MAFLVEDGTGLSAATSLCSVADADAYWSLRVGTIGAAWALLSTGEKERRLVLASDYVKNQVRYVWRGIKKTYEQSMPWPRSGATERRGQNVPDDLVPWQVRDSTAFLAGRASVDLQPDLARGGMIASESVGPISVSYFQGANASTVIQVVDGLLKPLLRDDTLSPISPDYTSPDMPSGYVDGEFDFQ